MRKTVEAIYKDGQFRPLEPLDLPDEARVKLMIEDQHDGAHERRSDPLARICEIAEDIGPKDFAKNLDSYLYGTKQL